MKSTLSLKKLPLSVRIIIAMILGVILGLLLGKNAAPLAEVGKLVIQLVKVVAIPLLFFTIINSILKTELNWFDGSRLIGWTTLNGSLALVMGLTLSNFIQPGRHLPSSDFGGPQLSQVEKLDFLKTLASYIPSHILEPFIQNSVIPLVLLALLFGLGLRQARNADGLEQSAKLVEQALEVLLKTTEIVLTWIIQLIPLAVLLVVAKAVGDYGFAPLKGLAYYVFVGLLGLTLHVLIVYHLWLKLLSKYTIKEFWRVARQPVIYALGANSSLATLPMTLKALKDLGVSRKASTLGACVGTNLNNDGIILYEAMAMLFVAQAYGHHLPISQQILAAVVCLIASMGVAGIPEAGFISLSIVLSTVGLPVELLPLLLTVDWIIARGRSAVNVLSDMVISVLLDREKART